MLRPQAGPGGALTLFLSYFIWTLASCQQAFSSCPRIHLDPVAFYQRCIPTPHSVIHLLTDSHSVVLTFYIEPEYVALPLYSLYLTQSLYWNRISPTIQSNLSNVARDIALIINLNSSGLPIRSNPSRPKGI